MASSPLWKVYTAEGVYVASCKRAEDAAAVVSLYSGATVRAGHARKDIVWTQGQDGDAGESYDAAGDKCRARLRSRMLSGLHADEGVGRE